MEGKLSPRGIKPAEKNQSPLSLEPAQMQPQSDRLSVASETRSPVTSPRGSAQSNPRLSDPEARALAASIDRKMESVLQSMRSRGGMSSGHSSTGREGEPTKPPTKPIDLTASAGDLDTFSSVDEDEPVEEMGIVDSMVNFVPQPAPAKASSVLRTERGNLAGSRAAKNEPNENGEEQQSAEPEPISPRNMAGKLIKKLTGGKKRLGAVFSPRKPQNKE